MMQLLYGNDGINYHTIAKSKDMTSAQEKELMTGYLGYDFVMDAGKYSSFVNEPISLSYVTTNLSNTLPEEMILVSKNARMSNYLTPSYYSHFRFMNMSEQLYGDDFLSILRVPFIEDVKLKDYLTQDIDTFQDVPGDVPELHTDAIEKDKLIAIVASLLYVADSMSKQVRLVLDVEGDAYNQRALDVIATIYTYLPFNVRKKAGFSTYAGTDSTSSSRVKLQLYTRDSLEKLGRSAIDLKNMDPVEVLKQVNPMAVELAKDFVNQDEKQRQDWFHSFQTVFKLDTVSVEEHISFYKNVRDWQTEDIEKSIDKLAKYAYTEGSKEVASPVYIMFRAIMTKRCAEIHFQDRFNQMIQEQLDRQKGFEFDNRFKAYIMLAEAVKGLELPSEMFTEWLNSRIIKPAEAHYGDKDKELLDYLKKQYQHMRGMKYGKELFRQVQQKMDEFLKTYIENLIQDIKNRIEKEKAFIVESFGEAALGLDDLDHIAEFKASVVYSENGSVFIQELYHNIEANLNLLPYFGSFEQYQEYKKFLEGCRKFIGDDMYHAMVELAEQKGAIVKAMEDIRKITWNNKADILKTYESFAKMHAVSDDKEVEVPDYALSFDEKEYALSEQELTDIMHFVFCPSEDTYVAFEDIARRQTEMMAGLLSVKVLGEAHFKFIMSNSMKLQISATSILRYYLFGSVTLSESDVLDVLKDMNEDTVTELFEKSVDKDNIIRSALEKKLGLDVKKVDDFSIERGSHSQKNRNFDDDERLGRYEEERKANRKRMLDEEDEEEIPERAWRKKAQAEKEEFGYPWLVLCATLLPAIMFSISACLKVILVSEIMIPVCLTVINVIIAVGMFLVIQFLNEEKNPFSIGTMIGGILSILTIWLAWLIF